MQLFAKTTAYVSFNLLLVVLLAAVSQTSFAQFNPEINYQGKLTDTSNQAVTDGDYEVTYRLYTVPTGGGAVFTETATATVQNGLFSYMIGSSTSLSGVDFNQTLYLGIEVEGDGEMTPRKVIGAVPAAFVAEDANTVGGVASTSFLRNDVANSASALISFLGGASTTDIVVSGTSTVTTLEIDGESYTTLSGGSTGLQNVSGTLTANISESNLNITGGPTDGYLLQASSTATGGFIWQATSSLGFGSSNVSDLNDLNDVDTTGVNTGDLLSFDGADWVDVATSSLGLGDGTFLGLSDTPSSFTAGEVLYQSATGVSSSPAFYFASNRLGIGTTSLGARLTIDGDGGDIIRANTAGGAQTFTINSSGYLGVGTAIAPAVALEVQGNESGTAAIFRNSGSVPGVALGNATASSTPNIQGITSNLLGVSDILLQALGGKVAIGTTSATALLSVGSSTSNALTLGELYNSVYISGSLELDGALYDTVNDSAGANGFVLQTTGAGFEWVATSSLGISSGANVLADLTDVNTTGVNGGDILVFNGTQWVDFATTTFLMESEIDTETELEGFLTDVTNVFTNNDGALSDDDLSNNILNDLASTSLADPNDDQLVFWDDSDSQFEFITTLNDLAIGGNSLSVNKTGDWTGTIDGNNFADGAIETGDLLYGSGSGAISELTIGSNGDILFISGGLPAWTATSSLGLGDGSLGGLTDVDTTSAASGTVLVFDGTDWYSRATSTLGINGTADDLSDNNLADLADVGAASVLGSLLYYDGADWDDIATSSLNINTDNLVEGGNLFFTNQRADARIAATTSLPGLTTLANLDTVGTITSGVWQGSDIDGQYIATSTLGLYTDDVTEGTNLYFTNGRVSSYISGSTTITRLGQLIEEDELNIDGSPSDGYVLQASSTSVGGFIWVATTTLGIEGGNGDTLDGLDSTQFLRSDIVNATGSITNFTALNATTTTFGLGADSFNSLTGTGLQNSNGTLITTLGTEVNLANEVIGTLAISSTSLGITATGLEFSGDDIALTAGYVIPLSASTTEWNSFYTTPSSRITAGDALSWTGNTLDLDINELSTDADWGTGDFLVYYDDGGNTFKVAYDSLPGAGGGLTSLNGETAASQSFATTSDTNVTLAITSSGGVHTFNPGWTGTLAATRGGTGLGTINENEILIGGAGNTWTQVATSSLGLGDGSLGGLTDVDTTSAASGTVLVFDGTDWYSRATSTLGINGTADDLSDNNLADLADVGAASVLGSLLYYDGADWDDIATSSLGLGNGTFLGLSDTPGSFTANRVPFTNSGGTALTDSDGLVFDGTSFGIGTTSTDRLLNIAGAANAGARFTDSTNDVAVDIRAEDFQGFIGTFSNNDLRFVTNNNSRMTIDTAGDVGIGTTSPASKLDVWGDFRVGTSSVPTLFADTSANWVGIGTTTRNFGTGATTTERLTIAGGGIIANAPTDPQIVGGVDTAGQALDVTIAGRYAYVADLSNGLEIIDVSDPTNPTIVGGVDTDGFAYGVTIAGRYAYVADATNGLEIIDISDPTAPSVVGGVDTDGSAQGVTLAGRYAYVADNANGLEIIDISDPTNPVIVGGVDTDNNAKAVAIAGRYAYVADQANGLEIIDISDPTNPVIVGGVDTDGSAYGVTIAGRYAYVADATNGLEIIDISDPTNPVIVGGVDTDGSAYGVTIAGRYAYVADDTNGLEIIDISDPTAPSVVGGVDTDDSAYGVTIAGRYAYVADWSNGLKIIDIGGSEFSSLFAGALGATQANFDQDLIVGQNALVNSNLAVGNDARIGGLLSIQGYSSSTDTRNQALLSLGGENTRNSFMSFLGGVSSTTQNIWSMGLDNTDGAFRIASSSGLNTNNFLSILGNGNIGIGTTTPASKLDVWGDISIGSDLAISKFENGDSNDSYFFAGATSTSIQQVTGQGSNIAFLQSLRNITTGARNFAVGNSALNSVTTGSDNIALGVQASLLNDTGNYNIAIGRSALIANVGTGTIGIGFDAGGNSSSVNRGIAIGYDVDFANTTDDYQLNIGNLIFGTGVDGTGTTLSSGNLGIGTSSPASKLDVWGDFRVGTSGTPALYVNPANGFVGVNRTTPGGSQGYLFGVTGGIYSVDNIEIAGTSKIFGTNTGPDTGFSFPASNTMLFDSSNSDVLRMSSANGSIFNGENSASQDFRIEADIIDDLFFADAGLQFVGIATDTPAYTLSVEGDIHATGALYDNANSAGVNGYVLQSDGGGFNWVATSSLGFGGSSLFTDGGATTYLTSLNDNLSIGTTTSSGLLTISTSSSATALSVQQYGGADSFNVFDGNTEVFTIEDGGNVGIGISDPEESLHVSGGNILLDNNQFFYIDDAAGLGRTAMYVDNFDNMHIGSSQYDDLRLNVGGNNGALVIQDSTAFVGLNDLTPDSHFEVSANGGSGGTIMMLSSDDANDGDLLTVLESGNIGIGTTSPASKLDVWGDFRVGTSGTPTLFTDVSTGRVGIGSSTPSEAFSVEGNTLINGTFKNTGATGAEFYRDTNNTFAFSFDIFRSRNGGLVQNNDELGGLSFHANDGNGYHSTAIIRGEIDGAPGNNDLPGRLVFLTSPDDGNSPIERMRITNSGNVGIGTSSPRALLTIGSSTSDGLSVGELYNSAFIAGSLEIDGALYDNANSAGTNGMVLQSDGSGFNWVATSSLGIASGANVLGDLTDVDVTGAASGTLLSYNGTDWVDVATSSLAINTNDLIEGSNLFYTNARVSSYISGSTTITRLGQLINAAELADEDFGAFTVNSGVASLDTGVVSSSTLFASNWANGYVLAASTTASGGFDWLATSSLGFTSGDTVVTVAASDTDSSLSANADYVADGTADNVQIQAALDAVYAMGGGAVELLEGTYDIAASVNMATNTALVGQGMGNTTLVLANAVDAPVVTMDAEYSYLAQLSIDGNAAGQSSTNADGIADILVNNHNRGSSTIDSVEVFDAFDSGISLRDSNTRNMTVMNSFVHDNGDHGISTDIQNVRVVNNNISNNTDAGLLISSSQYMVISGNLISSNGGHGITTNVTNWVTIASNVIRDNGDAGIRTDFIYESTVTSNSISGNANAGIRTQADGGDVVFSGNSITSNGIGIHHTSNGGGSSFIGNTITYNSSYGFFGEAFDAQVNNNYFTNNGGSGATSTIYIDGSGYVIKDNFIADSSGSGHAIEITSGQSNTYLANNTIDGTGADTISDAGTNTIYDEQDRVTLTNRNDTEVGYNLFNITGSSSVALASLQQTGSGDIFELLDSSDNTALIVDASGNVGIGTSSPRALLTIGSSTSDGLSVGELYNSAFIAGSLEIDGALYDNANSAGVNGYVLQSDGGGFNWVATSSLGIASGANVLGDLTDVDVTGAASGTVIVYDGSNWYSRATSTLGINGTADDLSDNYLDDLASTSLADPNDDQLVFWDDSAGQFTFIDTLNDLAIGGTALSVNKTGDWTGTIDGNNFADGAIETGDLLYGSGSGAISELNIGSNGDILFISGGLPAWTATSSLGLGDGSLGGLTDVDVSGAASSSLLSFNGTTWVDIATSSLGLGNGTFLGLSDTPDSYTADRVLFTTSSAVASSSNLTFDGSLLSLGGTGLSLTGSTANIALGDNWLSGDGSDEGLYVDSNGRVGIGKNNPDQALDVNGNIVLSGVLRFSADTDRIEGSSNRLRFRVNNTDFVHIEENAFGIGDLGPDALLEVSASGGVSNYFMLSSDDGNDGDIVTVLNSGNVGIGTTSPNAKLTVAGDTYIGGNLRATGTVQFDTLTNGLLQADGSGNLSAVATSSLGLGNGTFLGLSDTPDSYTADRVLFTTSSAVASSSNLIFDGTNLGLGSTTPEGRLAIHNDAVDGAQVAGIRQYFNVTNSSLNDIIYGDNTYIDLAPTATTTMVGGIIRVEDNTTLGNNVQGFQVQTNRGSNTQGENTAIAGFGRTFGVKGVTEGDAGGVVEPAGVFAETRGTTQGNALRAFSDDITTATLVSFFQDTSSFSGTGLNMDFGGGGGSFTGNFIELQDAGSNQLVIDNLGTIYSSSTATSTFANGINILGGCFAINGSCISAGSGSLASLSDTTITSPLYGQGLFYDGSNWINGQIGSSTLAATSTYATDYVLQASSTAPGGFAWVATSTLGFGGSSVTFGSDNQIPFSNAGGTDFDYSSLFTFDGTTFLANATTSIGTTTATNARLSIQSEGTADILNLFETGGTEVFTVLESGNVGVGTTSPAATFAVGGTSLFANDVTLQDSTGATPQLNFTGNGSTSAIYMNSSREFIFESPEAMDFISTDTSTANKTFNMFKVSQSNRPGDMFFRLWGDGTGNEYLEISHNGFDGRIQTGAGDLSLESFTKRVAINETAPDAIFEVSGDGLADDLFFISSTDDADGDIFSILNNGNVGIGTTSPSAKFTLENTGFSGAGIIGSNTYLETTNSVESAVQFGGLSYIDATSTATTTLVGNMFRIADTTQFGNTIRGLEVQTNKGGNTKGENTALSGFARTFGVRGFTSADAGQSFEPAAGFFELGGAGSQGNALRAYSQNITTSELLSLFQEDSTFEGTGLLMNFGNGSGSFASTTGSKFVDLQNAGTSKFIVYESGETTIIGTTTIGTGDMSQWASLEIGYGGICVDNDGSCDATTTGRISSVSSFQGNSDLAEMYFSSQDLEPGELVAADDFISIERATGENGQVLGVVSTKPGLLLGSDDNPLTPGAGYPLALSGRVPVKLSDENGEIAVGDPLTLSSLPGVAMKATEADEIVGYALEGFDGENAYTEGFINQFGDDIAEPDYSAVPSLTKQAEKADCYYGGGVAAGEVAAEDCNPDDVEEVDPIADYIDQAEIDAARYEAEQAALNALRTEPATVVALGTSTVRVGKVTMFVDRGIHILASQQDILNELISTDTTIVLGAEVGSGETLWSRLKTLAQNFVDGVLAVTGIKADKVETSELCVDDVCVTADDLRALLEGTSGSAADDSANNTPATTGGDTTDDTDTDTSDNTDTGTTTTGGGSDTTDETPDNSGDTSASSTDTGETSSSTDTTTEPVEETESTQTASSTEETEASATTEDTTTDTETTPEPTPESETTEEEAPAPVEDPEPTPEPEPEVIEETEPEPEPEPETTPEEGATEA